MSYQIANIINVIVKTFTHVAIVFIVLTKFARSLGSFCEHGEMVCKSKVSVGILTEFYIYIL